VCLGKEEWVVEEEERRVDGNYVYLQDNDVDAIVA
jgi:hypothetical protein